MYTKQELEKLSIPELLEIASELGIKVSQNDEFETVIYAILDKAAENSAAGVPTPKRKRTRIAKDNSKVYTVNGTDGENLDSSTAKKSTKKPSLSAVIAEAAAAEAANAAEESTDNADATTEKPQPAEEKPAPKKRGRKSKKELEELAAAEEAKKAAEEANAATEEAPAASEPVEAAVPEADSVPEEAMNNSEAEELNENMLSQLQEKMAQTAKNQPEIIGEGVWEGDPGDGTDFIAVVDLPIEDQAAIPTVDIFDRPMTQQSQDQQAISPRLEYGRQNETFDFADLITGNGVLEILQDGYGFLRSSDYNYLSSPDDIYVNPQQIKRYSLKTGDVVECTVRPPHDNEKYFALSNVTTINGRQPQEVRDRVAFEHLTPLFPDEKFTLCGDPATTNP